MATKCRNPHCDYFQKTVPDGDFCPFCGEPLHDVNVGGAASFSPPPPAVDPWSAPPPTPSAPSAPVSPDPWGSPPAADPWGGAAWDQPMTPAAAPPAMNPFGGGYVAHPEPGLPPAAATPAATVVQARQPSLLLAHSSGQSFPVQGMFVQLGRRGGPKSPDIDLADLPHAQNVSRLHAHIQWDPNQRAYMLTDDRSTNGTFLNGRPLEPGKPYTLSNGDQLELGHEHLIQLRVSIT